VDFWVKLHELKYRWLQDYGHRKLIRRHKLQ